MRINAIRQELEIDENTFSGRIGKQKGYTVGVNSNTEGKEE